MEGVPLVDGRRAPVTRSRMPSGKNRTATASAALATGAGQRPVTSLPRAAQQVQHAAKLAGAEKIDDRQQLNVVHDPHRRVRKGQVREQDEADRPEAYDFRPGRVQHSDKNQHDERETPPVGAPPHDCRDSLQYRPTAQSPRHTAGGPPSTNHLPLQSRAEAPEAAESDRRQSLACRTGSRRASTRNTDRAANHQASVGSTTERSRES